MSNEESGHNPDMKRFKGEFQESCAINHSDSRRRLLWSMIYGWDGCRHCKCGPCTRLRIEKGLAFCEDKSCAACRKIQAETNQKSC